MAEREGFELAGMISAISKLLKQKEFQSPSIPSQPRVWQ